MYRQFGPSLQLRCGVMLCILCIFSLGKTAPQVPDDSIAASVAANTIPRPAATASADSVAADSASTPRLDKMTINARRVDLDRSAVTRISADVFSGKVADLPSVLEQVSGVTVNRTGGFGEYADASIRGASPRQVQVYLDGVPLNSAAGGAVDLSKISPSALREVTVFKGTVPLELMGSSAGAVIDLRSAGGNNGTDIVAEAGSFGYYKAGMMSALTKGPFVNHLSADYTQSINDYPYIHDNGTPYNDDDNVVRKKSNNAFSMAGLRYGGSITPTTRQRFDFLLSAGENRKEFFQKYYADTVQKARQTTLAGHGFVNWTLSPSEQGYVSLRGEGRFDRRLFLDPLGQYFIGGPRKDREDFPAGSLQACGMRMLGDWLQVKTLLRGGYEGYASENLLAGQADSAPRARRLNAGAAVEIAGTWERFSGALRYHHLYSIDRANFTPDLGTGRPQPQVQRGHFPNANFDCLWRLRPWCSVDGSLRYEYQPIGLADRYGWGNNYRGNHELRPERRSEASIGTTLHNAFVETSLSGFVGATFDLIELRPQYQQIIMAENSGNITFAGAEWDVHLRPFAFISIDNHATWVHKQRSASGNDAIDARPFLFNSPFRNDLRIACSFNWLTLGHGLHYRSPFFTGYTIAKDRKVVAPALTAYAAVRLPKNITITYRIENYGNVSYETLPGYAPVPGRMHFITGKISF